MPGLVGAKRKQNTCLCILIAAIVLGFAWEARAQRRWLGRRVRRCTQPAAPAPCLAAPATLTAKSAEEKWRPLFDGATLKGWEITDFGGQGEVEVKGGAIILEYGNSLTGVTYKGGSLPKTNYEVELEAKRLEGIDFFCGLTFPVADSYCSFIVSGWAGTVVGLSSIDGFDASDNETTQYKDFKDNRWYRIRVRVKPDRIQAWIDDERIVDQDIQGRRISTRIEVDLSQPLGISAFETKAALRNIRIRELH